MDFTAKRTQLLDESNPLQEVIVGKNTISTLSEILLEPSEACLIITPAELEEGIRIIVQNLAGDER